MAKKAQYQTRQMAEMISYLKSVQGSHVTAHDICEHFKEQGVTVGMATIYRHLERMVQEGTVAKYTVDQNSGSCFEYLGEHPVCYQPVCFHCKCEICGRLIHLKCEELAGIREHLQKCHGFRVNSMRTVFYGVCEECGKEEETCSEGKGM